VFMAEQEEPDMIRLDIYCFQNRISDLINALTDIIQGAISKDFRKQCRMLYASYCLCHLKGSAGCQKEERVVLLQYNDLALRHHSALVWL
jgi:hypothetical protein